MMTPLMLLLSSINENHKYDRPVDIMYLTRSDRTTILEEAHRLGQMVCDDDVILMTEDVQGNPVVDTTQVVNNALVTIHWGTAMMLTRLREAYDVFKKSNTAKLGEIDEDEDLGTDAVILRIEGNPKYAYVYVHSVMDARGMDYKAKILKIAELYSTIIGHNRMDNTSDRYNRLVARLELQATEQFWESLLMADWMRHGNAVPDVLTAADLETIKRELKDLGFYGFVNPYRMYTEFSGSRIHRKVDVKIDDTIIEFLEKVVRSGGAIA